MEPTLADRDAEVAVGPQRSQASQLPRRSDSEHCARMPRSRGMLGHSKMLRLLDSSLSPEARNRLRRWLWRLAVGVLALAAAGVLGVGLLIAYYSRALPDVQHLRGGYNPPQVSRIYAADGTLLFSEFVERRTV